MFGYKLGSFRCRLGRTITAVIQAQEFLRAKRSCVKKGHDLPHEDVYKLLRRVQIVKHMATLCIFLLFNSTSLLHKNGTTEHEKTIMGMVHEEYVIKD